MSRRRRRRRQTDDEAGVNLSPLIDCVFLLLIFFLVTTMFKKFEHQIPIRMPDITSALSSQSREDVTMIAMNQEGQLHRQAGLGQRGELRFGSPESLDTVLAELASAKQQGEPIRLVVETATRFQDVIDVLDRFQLAGFQDVDVRVTPRVRK